jgi:hypothetical protein
MSDQYGQPPTDPYQQPSWGQPAPQPGYGQQQPPGYQAGYPQPPGYQQPGSQAPTSGSPGYPTQVYPQPAPGQYGQPYAQNQYPYQPPPPPRRSRGGLIAVLVGAVVLLFLVAGVAAVAVVMRASESKTANGGPTGTRSGAAAPPVQAAGKISFVAPERIGALKKSADQSKIESMRSRLGNAGIQQPFAVSYDDSTAPGRTAIAWGGTGKVFGIGSAKSQLDAFFTSAGKEVGGGSVGARVDVDPGTVGGKAQCAKVDGLGLAMTMCAWAGQDALLGFLFPGVAPDKGAEQMRTMLPAIVVRT